jgi:3-oxoacyl-[acyl-carrier protein] reductase
MNDKLKQKKALVVGGTGGIGRAIADALAAAGVELAITGGHAKEKLDEALRSFAKAGASARGLLVDAHAPDAPDRIMAFSPEPDIVVCAWGPFKQAPLSETTPCDWQAIVNGSLVFPGKLVSLALPSMIRGRFGRILLFGGTNTSTIRGFRTTACYSAAKTALGVLAKSVALEAGPYGVSCNVICPGFVQTEYTSNATLAYYKQKAAGAPIFSAEQIAALAIDVLSSDVLNGAVIPADGGLVV